MPDNYCKILVVKLCCIGDVVFITPLIKALHNAFPEAKIGFLASRWIKDVVERIPFVDEIIFFDAPVYNRGLAARILETAGIIAGLRGKKYDLAVFGHRSSAFPLMAFLAGIKKRYGFKGTAMLTGSVHFDERLHETDRYLEILKLLNIRPEEKETILSAKESDLEKAEKLLAELKLDRSKKYIGIFPGGGENPGTVMPIKRWYPEKYAELCNSLFDKKGYSFIFMGDGRDKEVVKRVIGSVKNGVTAVDTSGRTDIGGLCGLLKRCELVIGGDTGPLHMAAALGIPTLMIFGPSDPRLVAPRGSLHRFIWKAVQCSPCYTPVSVLDRKNRIGNEFVCRTGTHECIKEIQVDEVLDGALELLGELKR
jgi:lipopolysaccharide heptosyltransferase II